MTDWLVVLVPLFKSVHITALSLWCGGLIAMPLMLAKHDPAVPQEDYDRIRKATHLTYTLGLTPSAVIAVIAGTWLIFMRDTFAPWFYAKLFFVMLLVAAHVWIGHVLVLVAEASHKVQPPKPYLPISAVLVSVVGILAMVLGKPELDWIQFPSWFLESMDGRLPFEVPRL